MWNGASQNETRGDVASRPRTRRGRGRVPKRGREGESSSRRGRLGARDSVAAARLTTSRLMKSWLFPFSAHKAQAGRSHAGVFGLVAARIGSNLSPSLTLVCSLPLTFSLPLVPSHPLAPSSFHALSRPSRPLALSPFRTLSRCRAPLVPSSFCALSCPRPFVPSRALVPSLALLPSCPLTLSASHPFTPSHAPLAPSCPFLI